jgi:hypothetical protein
MTVFERKQLPVFQLFFEAATPYRYIKILHLSQLFVT